MPEITVPAVLSELDTVNDFVAQQLERADCPMKIVIAVQTAVEEIFVNVVNYSGSEYAAVACDLQGDVLTLRICDGGVPYDPLKKPDPDVTLSAQERDIGGLGIFMTKKIMTSVSYEYAGGQNKLTMTKQL